MADETIILKVGVEGTGEGETKIKSLKQQLKDMKNEMLGLDEGSDRFKQLAKDAGALTDKIGDVSERVKALSSDTKRLDSLVRVGSAIAGGFQAAQGAMALFGSNSKEVEKAIQNIIAVQGILNGVQQIGTFLTTKQNGQSVLGIAIKYSEAAATGVATAAQWLWNTAIAAGMLPLTLFIGAVGLLTAGVAWLIKNIDFAINVFKALFGYSQNFETQEEQNAKQREQRSKAAAEQHKQRLKEITAERDARLDAADKQISALQLEKETLEANGESSEAVTVKILEAELEKTKAVLDANNQKMQSWITYYENLALLSGKSREDFIAEQKARGIDLVALQEKANELIKANEDSIQRSENAITQFKREQNEQRSADAQQAADEARRLEEERLKQLEKDRQAEFDAAEEHRVAVLEADRLFNERLEAEKEAQFQREFDLLEDQIDRENAAKELQAQQDKERQDRNFQTAQNYARAVNDLTKNIFTITNNLGKQDEESKLKRAKRQFQIKKALDMAEAAIDGTKAVLSTFANTPGGLAIKTAAAALAGVFAAAKIAAIGSAKFEGGASVSAPVSGSGSAGNATENVGNTQPNINAIPAGSTFLNQPMQKVVVVESDITKTQKKVGVIEAAATFG